MFGVAADMKSTAHEWTEGEFLLLKEAADTAGAAVTLEWDDYPNHHLHAHW
jgi:hypothetical protein